MVIVLSRPGIYLSLWLYVRQPGSPRRVLKFRFHENIRLQILDFCGVLCGILIHGIHQTKISED